MYRESLLCLVILLCMQVKAQLSVDTIADQKLNEVVVVVAKLLVLEIKADKMVYHPESSVVRPFERFLKAVNKVHNALQKERSLASDDFLFVKSDKQMRKVFLKDILFMEG